MEYSFCETVAASGTSKWHIRLLTDKGRKLGGGADTAALCKRTVAWDILAPLTEFHIGNNTCSVCRDEYYSTVQDLKRAEEYFKNIHSPEKVK